MSRPVPGSPGYGPLDSDGGRHDEAPRRIDADALALYLSRPSLALGLYPASPWADTAASDAPGGPYDATGGRPADARDVGKRLGVSERGAADPRELGERLRDAVRQAVGAHRTVAVLHDGSLGATALLAAADAVGRELGVEVTVVIADHPGPDGASAAVPTQRVLAALGGRHRFLLAESDRLPGPDNGPMFGAASDGRSGPGSGPVFPAASDGRSGPGSGPMFPAASDGRSGPGSGPMFRAASDGRSGPGGGSAPGSGPPVGAGSGPGSLKDGERGSGGHGAVWNPVAPDLARTALVRAAEVRAARLGATLILIADGCEELLQAGPVAVPSGLAGLTAVRRGLADRWRGEGAAAVLADAAAVLGRGPRARRLRARLQVALAPFADALTEAPRVLAPERLARVETWTAAWISRLVERVAGERDPVRAYALARMARFAGPLPAAVAAAAAVPRRSPFLDPAFTAWALRLPPNARYDASLPASHLRRAALVVSLVPRTARGALPSTPVPLKPAPGPGTAWEPERGFGVGAFPLCLDHGILAPGGGPVEPLVAARLAVLEGWLAGAGRVSR